MSDFAECPCCRYPTLTTRYDFEICTICWWEDGFGSEDRPDEPCGGPNGDYSLARARSNFTDHFDMYDAGKGIGVVAHPSPARKILLAYLRGVRDGERSHDKRVLHGLLRGLSHD